MSKTVTNSDRSAMQDALWLARNVTCICTSVPQCQTSSFLQETVEGWVRRVEAIFNHHDVFRGSWEANVLIQAMDAYDRWRLDPADHTFNYTMSQLPTPAKAELELGKAQDKLAAARKELVEVRTALMTYRQAYNATRSALYKASQEAALIQEGLFRDLPSDYTQPWGSCGLTGPGFGGSNG